METAKNGELGVCVAIETEAQAWEASPAAGVERKRLHRVGSAEAGQVTSIVRYAPGSSFPAHDHPEGEEILVLEGVFSDEHGDWPAGTYLVNPEGFRHAPFSRTGCVLFVKLRQLPGEGREHVVVDTRSLPWQPSELPGVEAKPLYQQQGFRDTVRLERWAPGAAPGALHHEHGAEILVLEGSFEDEQGRHPRGSWLRLPAGASHSPRCSAGCRLYVKRAGLPLLRGAA